MFNIEKDFGFIKEENTNSDFFSHISQFEKKFTPQKGMRVEFEIEDAEKGEKVMNICVKKNLIFT